MPYQPIGKFDADLGVPRESEFKRPVTFYDRVRFVGANSTIEIFGGSIRGDLYSSDWNGGFDLSGGADTSATAGYLFDWDSGAAQFQTIYAEGGELGTLDVLGALTLGTGGVIRTASSGARLEIAQGTLDRIYWYTGDGAETQPGRLQMSAAAGASLLQLYAPKMAGNWPSLIMLAGPGDSEIQLNTDKVSVSEDINVIGQFLSAALGTAAAPDYSWSSDPNTGMFRNSADTLGFSAGGTEGILLSSTYLFALGNTIGEPAIRHSLAGTAAAPTYSWVSDLDTGIFRKGANQIGFSMGGTDYIRFSASDYQPIDQEAWTAPTLLNSWVDFGSGFQGARYRITKEGIVMIQGLVKNGTAANADIFTLPAGYRPAAQLILPARSSAGASEIRINASGVVEMTNGGSTTWNNITVSFQI